MQVGSGRELTRSGGWSDITVHNIPNMMTPCGNDIIVPGTTCSNALVYGQTLLAKTRVLWQNILGTIISLPCGIITWGGTSPTG